MKNDIIKILQAVIKLEETKTKPTTDEINKLLKSDFEEEYISQLVNSGLLSIGYIDGYKKFFISTPNTRPYIHEAKRNSITFWTVIATLVVSVITLLCTLIR